MSLLFFLCTLFELILVGRFDFDFLLNFGLEVIHFMLVGLRNLKQLDVAILIHIKVHYTFGLSF